MGRWDTLWLRTLLVVVICCLTHGCAKPAKSVVDEQDSDFRQISRAYSVAISMASQKPPQNVEKIREIVADLHKAKLGDSPDEVLTSSRDGQPYVIVLGVPLGQDLGDAIFLYEKTGANGTRYVMTVGRVVKQLSDSDFAQATFAKGHQPEKN